MSPNDSQLTNAAQSIANLLKGQLGKSAGEGQFKKVFELQHDGEKRALKVCKRSGVDPRVIREVEAITDCNHDHIAKVHLHGTEEIEGEEIFYYIEEFIDGGSLDDEFASGPCTRERAIEIGLSVTDALTHLYERSLVHRDIKPANVMIRSSGELVLVDFGLVRNLAAPSLTPTMFHRGPGTPIYAAPEQLNNDKHLIDWRSDQFSLGVMLATGMSGLHPYQQHSGVSLEDVVDRVAERQPVAESFLQYVGVADIEPLVRMTASYPVRRYRKPEDLLEAFREANEK